MNRLQNEWEGLSSWWLAELAGDPAYGEEVEPLLIELLRPQAMSTYLDVGAGEGRLMRIVGERGGRVVGVDLLHDLLVLTNAPSVRVRLPSLSSFRASVFDGAYVCLVLEHLADERRLFSELARVIKPAGEVVLVINHPYFTAPGSAPIQEPDEILWRPGSYFDRGVSDERIGAATIQFHHRPLADLLNAAADAGFDLRRVVEVGVSEAQVERTPVLDGQRHIPRLLGVRWTRSSI